MAEKRYQSFGPLSPLPSPLQKTPTNSPSLTRAVIKDSERRKRTLRRRFNTPCQNFAPNMCQPRKLEFTEEFEELLSTGLKVTGALSIDNQPLSMSSPKNERDNLPLGVMLKINEFPPSVNCYQEGLSDRKAKEATPKLPPFTPSNSPCLVRSVIKKSGVRKRTLRHRAVTPLPRIETNLPRPFKLNFNENLQESSADDSLDMTFSDGDLTPKSNIFAVKGKMDMSGDGLASK